MDPLAATTLGLLAGGGTSLTIHAGKAALRAKSSMLAPLHAGTGNAALSLGEDFITGAGVINNSGVTQNFISPAG